MLEYLPWSSVELENTIKAYKEEKMTILDIELGGTCNFNCIYCDSPDKHKIFCVHLERVQAEIEKGFIRWIFICGLGEPTYGDNRRVLIKLLHLAEKNNVKISMFTNLSHLDDEILGFIKRGILCVLFKLDSFERECTNYLYGADTRKQLCKIKLLMEAIRVKDGCTNVGASIVPTVKNIDEIPNIVKWCIEHDIYPLIAELEHAGKGTDRYKELSPTKEKMVELKETLLSKFGIDIHIPLCASIIGGIHINNKGCITVDKKTGFSCHWFWLENPIVESLGDFNNDSDMENMTNEIIEYRKSKKNMVVHALEDGITDPYVFGGCGGSIEDILKIHLKLHS